MVTTSAQSISAKIGRIVRSKATAILSYQAANSAWSALSHVRDPLHAVKIMALVASRSTISAPADLSFATNEPSGFNFVQPSGGLVQR